MIGWGRPGQWILIAALLLIVSLGACNRIQDDGSGDAPVQPSAAEPPATTLAIQRGGDALIEALDLLASRYVGGADVTQLLAAGQRGAWRALAITGAIPREPEPNTPEMVLRETLKLGATASGRGLEAPAKNATLREPANGYQLRYARLARRFASKADPEWLAHEMIREAADSLDDCHTGFLTRRQVEDQVRRMSGTARFGGIGVILRRLEDGSFVVVEVFDGTPAEKAGIRPGERIVSVDGESLDGKGIEQVVQIVRGPEGSAVRLGISRAGAPSARQVDVVRAQVAAPILRAAILEGNIGYVRFYGFPEPLTSQVDSALSELQRRNVVGLVVDVRDNSGGQLDVVTKVTSRFVPQGPIFQSINQDGQRTIYQADGSVVKGLPPTVVLINGGTGSGGEIFASAIREHGVARLVGNTTAGCVSTGRMFPLRDGSAIEIATERVVSGLRGSEMNRVGVAADVMIVVPPDDLASERDRQLARAVEILRNG